MSQQKSELSNINWLNKWTGQKNQLAKISVVQKILFPKKNLSKKISLKNFNP